MGCQEHPAGCSPLKPAQLLQVTGHKALLWLCRALGWKFCFAWICLDLHEAFLFLGLICCFYSHFSDDQVAALNLHCLPSKGITTAFIHRVATCSSCVQSETFTVLAEWCRVGLVWEKRLQRWAPKGCCRGTGYWGQGMGWCWALQGYN